MSKGLALGVSRNPPLSQDIYGPGPACRVGSGTPRFCSGSSGAGPGSTGLPPTPLSHLWSQNSHPGREASTSLPPALLTLPQVHSLLTTPLLHLEACIEHPLHTLWLSSLRDEGTSRLRRPQEPRGSLSSWPSLRASGWCGMNVGELSVGAGGRGPEGVGRLPGGGPRARLKAEVHTGPGWGAAPG